jgi:hypothetical protein
MRYLVIVLVLLVGCTGSKNKADSSGDKGPVSLKFKSEGVASGMGILSNDQPVPILFGTLGVAAYYYRPGASEQMGTGSSDGYFNWNSSDWSRWMMVAPNRAGARDFLLTSGDDLDIGSMSDGHFYDDVTSDYIASTGVFSMDIISVVGAKALVSGRKNHHRLPEPEFLL